MAHQASAQTSSMAAGPETFTKFGSLPPELRIKIWQEAIPDARTVVVKAPAPQGPKSLDELLTCSQEPETWFSTTQIPTLLHVNAEARHEALKHYKLSLGCGPAQPRIYVDFSRDTVFFGNSELKPACSSLWATTQGLHEVQRLAVVPEGAWRVLRWKKVDLNALKKISFVHETENKKLGSLPQLVEDTPQQELHDIMERIEQVERQSLEETEEGKEEEAKVGPVKKRMEAARDEVDTLMALLASNGAQGPAISTALFKD